MRSAIIVVIVGVGACSSSSSPSGGDDAGTDSSMTDGSTCPSGQAPCAGTCCNANAVCVDDGTGNKSCAATCTTNSQCPPAKGCCAIVPGMAGKGACVPQGITTGQQCRCSTAMDCQTGCCAPIADANNNPVGPYICKANDNSPYGCCNGASQNCSNGYCCVHETSTGNGSYICEEPCHNDGNCGANGACTMLTSGTCAGSPGGCVPR